MILDKESWIDVVRSGINACVQWNVDVILLSLGSPETVFSLDDPLLLATRVASEHHIPVVVAAGNFGPGKLQALSLAPWVITVGAVDVDEKLLADSGTGPAGGSGPTVVSYGTELEKQAQGPKWGEFGPGTSFALPRVAGVAAFIRSCLRLMISEVAALHSEPGSEMSQSVKVPVIGVVDTGVDLPQIQAVAPVEARKDQQGHTEVRLTRTSEEERWYTNVVEALKGGAAECLLSDESEAVKRTLQLLARRLEGYAMHEVGAGLVSLSEAQAFLSSLTPERWFGIFCPEAIRKLGPDRIVDMNNSLGVLWTEEKVQELQLNFYDRIRLAVVEVY